MPFQSEKQRRYLWANEPEIARDWTDRYGANQGGIMRIPFRKPVGLTVGNQMTMMGTPNTNVFSPLNIRDESYETFSPGITSLDNDIDSGIGGLDFEAENVTPTFETSEQEEEYLNRVRNMPPIQDSNWWREKTGKDVFEHPDFPLRKENLQAFYETGKENLGGIVDYAKEKGIQGKDLLMTGLGKAVNLPLGIASMLGDISPDNPYQKFQKGMFEGYVDPANPNKDPWGKNIRSFKDTYDVTDQWDKFSGSKLGQKYDLAALDDPNLTEEEREDLIAEMQAKGLSGYQLNKVRGLSRFNRRAQVWKKQKATQKKTLQEHQGREARQAELDRRQQAADRSRQQTGQTTSGGAGHYDSSKDHSGPGGYGGTGRASDAARSKDLGFSDIRLKDNIELMGQSPSNINIYKFNYLNDPTVYQGVMAQEVPWASVKADNGYLMVDYDKVDVEFKKWHRK